MKKTKYISSSPEDTLKIAHEFAKNLKGGTVVAFYGELGSGKTTFIQGMAAAFGIKKKIPSPTFTLLRSYAVPDSSLVLNHLDLYRISTGQELGSLGFNELIKDPEGLTLVEWAEKIEDLLPMKHIDIKMRYLGKSKREITIREMN